jgi:hypothetical protein
LYKRFCLEHIEATTIGEKIFSTKGKKNYRLKKEDEDIITHCQREKKMAERGNDIVVCGKHK